MLRLSRDVHRRMVGHCYDGLPLEACGLLAGSIGSHASECYPAINEAESARYYTVRPKDLLLADRDADGRGMVLVGVFHSHTHTDAYPSPTDIDQAPDPNWHYVIVSLRDEAPVVRSFRIVDGKVSEEPVVVES